MNTKEMINLPMLGTTEKTESSRFQITLVDKTNRSLKAVEKPRMNRFFDNIEDRNKFLALFESSIIQAGGNLVLSLRSSCFSNNSLHLAPYGRSAQEKREISTINKGE